MKRFATCLLLAATAVLLAGELNTAQAQFGFFRVGQRAAARQGTRQGIRNAARVQTQQQILGVQAIHGGINVSRLRVAPVRVQAVVVPHHVQRVQQVLVPAQAHYVQRVQAVAAYQPLGFARVGYGGFTAAVRQPAFAGFCPVTGQPIFR